MSRVTELLADFAMWDDMAKQKRKELQRLRDRRTSVHVTYSEAPGGTPETMEEYIAKRSELEEDLEEIKEHRYAAFSQIMRLAFRLDSQKQIDIIYRRDIHRDSWRKICRDLDIKRSSATDLHARAVRAMEAIDEKG